MILSKFVGRRQWAGAAAVAAGCLFLAGCGGSGGSPAAQTPPGGIKPIGPADLTANVIGLMKANQPQLGSVKAKCPSGPVTHFPVHCSFTAMQIAATPGSTKVGKGKKAKTVKFPGPYPVAGTISVFGVYFRTRTYEYSLNYAPTHGIP